MTSFANPVIEINDDPIFIKPNSLVVKKGHGTTNVRAQSAGGGSIDTVDTEDAETKKSLIKFTLYTTSKNIDLYDEWHSYKENGNVVSISEKDGSLAISFVKMKVVSDNEISTGADGEFEVELNGPPVI